MTNPFLSREHLNPQIATAVGEAFVRNQERSLAPGAAAGDISVRSLADVIKSNTADANIRNSLGIIGFDELSDPEVREDFEDSFKDAELLFSRLNLEVPTIEQCVEAGVNLAALGDRYQQMQDIRLNPAIILSPNLGYTSWYSLYRDLANDKTLNSNARLGGAGVDFSAMVLNGWSNLSLPPEGTPVILTPDKTLTWSLRLIPSTPYPTITCVEHSYNAAVHPTISEYLSLQALRFQAYQEPIDNNDSTWLSGTTLNPDKDELCAPIGFWEKVDGWDGGFVSIGRGPVSLQSTILGCRLPKSE